jgi:hypothetical protein
MGSWGPHTSEVETSIQGLGGEGESSLTDRRRRRPNKIGAEMPRHQFALVQFFSFGIHVTQAVTHTESTLALNIPATRLATRGQYVN